MGGDQTKKGPHLKELVSNIQQFNIHGNCLNYVQIIQKLCRIMLELHE